MAQKIVTFGEIMMRLATPGYYRFHQSPHLEMTFGGGEANVAVSLANFGLNTAFVSRLPNNDLGKSAEMDLKKYGVDTSHIIYGGKRLGIYFLESGAVSRASKVIYDRAHSSISEIEKGMINWKDVLENATWFHWTGITPAISENAATVCLEAIETARQLDITVSCDLNFRKNLWKYGKKASEVMPELVAGCDIILGNEEDAAMVLGIHPEGVDVTSGHVEAEAYISVSEQIMKQFPQCKKVITTLRGSVSASHNSWSGVLWDGQKLFEAPTYQITHIVDRVGGGDSFMGGLIYGLLQYPGDDQKALNFAVAASCLKHTLHGDYNQVNIEEVEKLMAGDASGRVSR
ncbi:MAG: sugar kinase [Cyclobacteriaceae bacterium]|nr:sugar kinase [Cyclobacteriaceae bacterium]